MIHLMNLRTTRPMSGMAVYLVAADGDIDKVGVVDPENIDIGRNPIPNGNSMRSGRRVTVDHLPTRVRKANGRGALDDIESALLGQIVTDRFREMVEDLCGPGTHQFEPVEVINPSGKEDRHRWWFVPAVRLRALDPDRVDPPLHELGFYLGKAAKDWTLAFRQEVVTGHHIFCTAEFISPAIWVDDAFVAAVEAAGLTGMAFDLSFPVS